jgi:hypothetical protein
MICATYSIDMLSGVCKRAIIGALGFAFVMFLSVVILEDSATAQTTSCPAVRTVVDIRASNDPLIRRRQMIVLRYYVDRENTTVRLGPGVDLNFSEFPDDFFPIYFGRCVTLTSVAHMDGTEPWSVSSISPTAQVGRLADEAALRFVDGSPPPGEGRTSRSLGPVLRFGPHRPRARVFLAVKCYVNGRINDGVRISGFQLYGPSFRQQSDVNFGIQITRCIDVEIANMEIAGWGAAAVTVLDEAGGDQAPATNRPGGRIIGPHQILIHDNYFHNNQHPSTADLGFTTSFPFVASFRAEGYGVSVGAGAWARISRNLFDLNRHAIAASGDTGGYWAEDNLVLRGGGYHGRTFNAYTHMFDAHGTGCWWSSDLCGNAGRQFWYYSNAFQYRKDTSIKIRGRPDIAALIARNVFPFSDPDDAIDLYTSDNVDIGSGNLFGIDTFGRYGICDFDGDGADDLFLATGASWWYSSGGEFPWSFLNARNDRQVNLRFGDFDGDRRCDVLTDHGGRWEFSSGGTGPWTSLGSFGPPFSEVRFGRFNPRFRDHRRNILLRTTHAFWRRDDGQWFVTPLSAPDWQPVASSGFPLSALRFGDFTGDGVTDVLAVVGGRWSISESAVLGWRPINTLHDPVAPLHVANMDPDDNIDDLLRLDRNFVSQKVGWQVWVQAELTWMRSRNGTEPWRVWRRYRFDYLASPDKETPVFGFAGRFGSAPGGGTLTIDPDRFGQFHDPAEAAAGRSPDWDSLFPY